MLTQLTIKNIVLIESCNITFEQGLCVLSGETGAGKSILLDALGLVLGARSNSGLIRRDQAQAVISAEFDISNNEAAQLLLNELDIEASDCLIIRRSISTDGKGRCLINDQPVTVAALKKLGEKLVEIHGQHDQRSLQDATIHRDLLDEFAGAKAQREKVTKLYLGWQGDVMAIKAIESEIEKIAHEQDYLLHIQGELKTLNPQAGEEEELATKRSTMMQSEKLFEIINDATRELNNGKGVLAALHSAQRALTRSPLTSSGAYSPVIDGLEKAAMETEAAIDALEKAGEEATYSPQKLEQTEERLFELRAASRKYNKPVDGLAEFYAKVKLKLEKLNSQEHDMRDLKQKAEKSKAAFVLAAKKLSETRQKAAGVFEKKVAAELAPLKMNGTKFRVQVAALEESGWSEAGVDRVAFECATNVSKGAKSVSYSSLKQIASGGELSRFMLALKVVLSDTRSTSTMIFDEIDAGTGGAVADAIGARLAKLGAKSQVLVVTHLPQVAARGNQHLLVSKSEKAKKIITKVESLSADKREEELARMLAGASITKEARKAAQKLLEEAA